MRGLKRVRNNLVDLEDMTDEELERLQREFERLRNLSAQKNDKRERSE